MIGAEEDQKGLPESFTNKVGIMEQEDGEVSDASNCEVANDEGEIVDQQTSKSHRKEDDPLAKTDVNASKKTALEKLKNMSFSSRSKLPVRRTAKLQHSPRRDNDEERRQRKRRWEERNDEDRHQANAEERPRPLREAVAAAHVAPLPIRSVEPARPNDQPHTLRQRVEKLISVQESEAINMSDKELRNLIARMCDLSKEQQRLQRGRQTQFDTLREIYMEVKDDIEKLYIRIPVHLRMDLPLPPQSLHPSASSSGGPLQMNGGTTAFQLEQRFRLPSLFDSPQVIGSANMRLNPGNDSEVNVRSEERCTGGRMGFGEVGSVSSDPQRVLGGRNGTVFSGGLNEHGMFEDISRIGMGSGGTLLRNDSNSTTAVERAPHTGSGSEQTVHSINGKKPLFPGLNGPSHLDQSASMIPSTSACDPAPKPLFSRLDFADGNSRFSGSGPSHDMFAKIATDLPSQMGSFNDRPSALMSFGNTASPNQASHSIGRQIYDTADKSATSNYAGVQTNALNKLESGAGVYSFPENDGGIRGVNQHCRMHSGSQGPNSFIHPNKPASPVSDFPSNLSIRTVSNSVDTDTTLCSTYHESLIHLKSNEIQSSSQVPLPNLSEPPPPFGTAPMNGPAMLSNKLPNAVLLNTMQNSNIVPTQTVPSPAVSGSAYPSEHPVGTLQSLASTAAGSALNSLPGSNTSQNLQSQPGNAAVAPSLMSLHSASSTVSVPPPDFSVPPPLPPSLTTRTSVGTPITSNLLSHTEPTSSGDSRTGPASNPPLQRSLSHMKGGVLPNSTVLSGLPSMNVPPPSFSVPPPRAPPTFPTPPPMASSGITSGPRPVNLASSMVAPPPNLMTGPVGLSCPPPDMSQPPPNIRNALGAGNPEGVQQMVTAVVGQSAVIGQTPVEVVTELIANAYNRAGGIRLHHDASLKQRMSMTTENTVMINKMRAPAPAGPPRPLSSVGKLPPPLMLSPSTRGGPPSRISSFNKRKGSQIRPSATRPQQRQKRQISDMVAIIPDEHDHPSSREEPDDNIFLIVSDEEDGNKLEHIIGYLGLPFYYQTSPRLRFQCFVITLLFLIFRIVVGKFFERPSFVFETASTAAASTVDTRCGSGNGWTVSKHDGSCNPEASKKAGIVMPGVGW
uniref:Uncharacterized protein n=1 Tax=Setaria digitata TaxID=48799 RepID=A0A915PWL9_9BILA